MKLKFIDSIRGIAILMVIAHHSGGMIANLDWFSLHFTFYGRMGVQLFFFISAYTLCLSFEKRKKESYPLLSYGIRRYFRIAPSYYIAILGYFLLSLVYSWSRNFGQLIIPEKYSFWNVLSNLLFYHGFYPPGNNNIVSGGWSIGTEMGFYVLFPILFFIAKKMNLGKLKTVSIWVGSLLLLSHFILWTVELTLGYSVQKSFMYFNLANQLPVFGIGIAYFFFTYKQPISYNWKIQSFLFIVLTCIAIYFQSEKSLIGVLSALSFIFLVELFRNNEILNSSLLQNIGKVSFSMYLIHFIFAEDLLEVVAPFLLKFINPSITHLTLYLLSVACSYILAKLSFRFIEQRFIKLGAKIIHKIQTKHPI